MPIITDYYETNYAMLQHSKKETATMGESKKAERDTKKLPRRNFLRAAAPQLRRAHSACIAPNRPKRQAFPIPRQPDICVRQQALAWAFKAACSPDS